MPSRPKLLPVLLLVAVGAVLASVVLPHRLAYPFDDTFITFRYAHNLAAGHGIVWNPGGPHTEGYTNFLLVLLLAAADLLHLDLLLTAQSIMILATIGSALLAFRITRRLSGPIAAWIAALIIYIDPFIWANAMSALETNLFVLFVLWTWYDFIRHRPSAYVVALLATLTRPEGAILAAILFVLHVREYGLPHALRLAMSFIVPIALYAAWKLWYFGNLLPNSFYVKVVQAHGGHKPLLPGLGAVKTFYYQNALLFCFAAITLVYIVRARNAHRLPLVFAWTWIVVMSLFYCASYLLMGKYDRFTLSIETMVLILAVIGESALPIVLSSSSRVLRLLTGIALVAAFGYSVLDVRGGDALISVTGNPNAGYERVGQIIARLPDHGEITIASADAGVLPYYSETGHLDLVGLNTTAIAHAGSVDTILAYVAASKPDLIFIPVRRDSGDSCVWIFREGHGLIGPSYTRFVEDPRFSDYHSIGRVDIGYYDMDILARDNSRFRSQLVSSLRSVLTEPTRCYR